MLIYKNSTNPPYKRLRVCSAQSNRKRASGRATVKKLSRRNINFLKSLGLKVKQ